jgi:hypothetical protein
MITSVSTAGKHVGHVAHFKERPGEYTATPSGRPHLAQAFPTMTAAANYLFAAGSIASDPRPSPVRTRGQLPNT